MDDHGKRTSTSPSSSQTRSITTRRIRFIMGLGLWEIIHGVATASPARGSWSAFLKGRNVIGHVAIVNVHRIDLAETIEGCGRFTSHFERDAQIVTQRKNGFLLKLRNFEGSLVPQGGNLRLALVNEGE